MTDRVFIVTELNHYLEKTELWKNIRETLSMPESFDAAAKYLVKKAIEVPLESSVRMDSTSIYSAIDDIIMEQAEMVAQVDDAAYDKLYLLYNYLANISFTIRMILDELDLEGSWYCESYRRDDLILRRLRN